MASESAVWAGFHCLTGGDSAGATQEQGHRNHVEWTNGLETCLNVPSVMKEK